MKLSLTPTRILKWIVSLCTSVAALIFSQYIPEELATIEGLDPFSMAATSEVGLMWIQRFALISACLFLPVFRGVQIALLSLAYGIFLFVLVDFQAQLEEFVKMGIVAEDFEKGIKISTAGKTVAASAIFFGVVLVFEQLCQIYRRLRRFLDSCSRR